MSFSGISSVRSRLLKLCEAQHRPCSSGVAGEPDDAALKAIRARICELLARSGPHGRRHCRLHGSDVGHPTTARGRRGTSSGPKTPKDGMGQPACLDENAISSFPVEGRYLSALGRMGKCPFTPRFGCGKAAGQLTRRRPFRPDPARSRNHVRRNPHFGV